jgi:hypothetical protein
MNICAVCYSIMSPDNSIRPIDTHIQYTCPHYLHIECWRQLYINHYIRCPVCRRDLSHWLSRLFGRRDRFELLRRYSEDRAPHHMWDTIEMLNTEFYEYYSSRNI